MKITLGLVQGSLVKLWRLITLQVYGNGDVRGNVIEASPFGVDSNPLPGMVGLYARTENNGQPVCIGYVDMNKLISQAPIVQPGETRIFSTDANGNLVANVYATNDGRVLIGPTAKPLDYNDFAVGFNKMAEFCNTLKADYNGHQHPVTGINIPTGAPVTPTEAVIEPSKVDYIQYKT